MTLKAASMRKKAPAMTKKASLLAKKASLGQPQGGLKPTALLSAANAIGCMAMVGRGSPYALHAEVGGQMAMAGQDPPYVC